MIHHTNQSKQSQGLKNVWSRLRGGSSSLASSISNISLGSGDKDGSTADSTLIHNSLVKFYANNNNGNLPNWLGVSLEQQQQLRQHNSHRHTFKTSHHRNNDAEINNNTTPMNSGSSLQDIYNRRSSSTISGNSLLR
ncbi:hypothetical protein NADFUDRAFT_82401 [Nadsonia fulvescens var. elongata DSM 6958]|uniref:Mso1 N-terminal domain-containing protein n=1 Tax=Nadsonia fulvescens var. elongata DSM 6958 TaxID=857566 RepID=A0A1E3PNZ0_9ASCO|nr:hypothetical protein NADFUDRAFT_82401 [Nadsonia fulvescens var. elongata DSM 6958]